MLVRFSNAYADQLEHLFKKLKNIDKPLIYNFVPSLSLETAI